MRRTLGLVLLVGLLVGCSSGDDDEAEPASTTSTTATDTIRVSITTSSGSIAPNVDDINCLLGGRYEVRDGEGAVLTTGEIDETAQVQGTAPNYLCLQLEDIDTPVADFYEVRLSGDGFDETLTVSADEADTSGITLDLG